MYYKPVGSQMYCPCGIQPPLGVCPCVCMSVCACVCTYVCVCGVPGRCSADTGPQGPRSVPRWRSPVRGSGSRHTPHTHSRPGQGVGTTRLGTSSSHTPPAPSETSTRTHRTCVLGHDANPLPRAPSPDILTVHVQSSHGALVAGNCCPSA